MKKFSSIFLLVLVLTMIITPSVNGFIIDQHVTIANSALEATPSSPITQAILPYKDYYIACNLLTDISVVSYFQIDNDDDPSILGRLLNIFTFNIGKTYRATHSPNSVLRALSVAENPKEVACAYGIGSHLVADAISHNEGVPLAIEKTKLFNGLVHSIKEIHDKDLIATNADFVESRQVLDLGYEMTPYFERVFVEDPAFSDVSIPNLIDFFIKNVQPDGEYRLGFRSFFALPTYIYWMVLILFLLSLSLFAFTVRRIKDGMRNIPTVFSALFSIVLLGLVGTAIYGLATGSIWKIWEILSQFLFSPAMYAVGGGLLIVGFALIYLFFKEKKKLDNLATLLVALFVILIGAYMLTLPNGLTIGNEQALHSKAIEGTKLFLNQGVNYIKTIQDPVGFNALKNADAQGRGARSLFMGVNIALLAGILFFTFRKRKRG